MTSPALTRATRCVNGPQTGRAHAPTRRSPLPERLPAGSAVRDMRNAYVRLGCVNRFEVLPLSGSECIVEAWPRLALARVTPWPSFFAPHTELPARPSAEALTRARNDARSAAHTKLSRNTSHGTAPSTGCWRPAVSLQMLDPSKTQRGSCLSMSRSAFRRSAGTHEPLNVQTRMERIR